MCNLYSMTKGQAAIRALTRAMADKTGNMPPLPGIFPDYGAPIVREGADGREIVLARWGMPSPVFALKGKKTDPGVTNIRNTRSPHWRRWLWPESRCLVPFTSFSENELTPGGSKQPMWFALDEDRPLAFFAGIWTRWTSIRKIKEGEVTADLFGFLTTEPNTEVAAIHPQAMPAILTTEEEREVWLKAPWSEASALQRPLPTAPYGWCSGARNRTGRWTWSILPRRRANRTLNFRCHCWMGRRTGRTMQRCRRSGERSSGTLAIGDRLPPPPKAMPVILTEPEEVDLWLSGPPLHFRFRGALTDYGLYPQARG